LSFGTNKSINFFTLGLSFFSLGGLSGPNCVFLTIFFIFCCSFFPLGGLSGPNCEILTAFFAVFLSVNAGTFALNSSAFFFLFSSLFTFLFSLSTFKSLSTNAIFFFLFSIVSCFNAF